MPKGTKKAAPISGTAIAALVLNPPSPARQVRFYQLLVAARRQWFMDALSEALGQLDQSIVKGQIREYVPGDVQQILAAAGLRDEYVFPVPAVIETKASLVGYYRLLLGAPQKSFYKGSTGMGRFKSMEELGTLSEKTRHLVPNFCLAMGESAGGTRAPDTQDHRARPARTTTAHLRLSIAGFQQYSDREDSHEGRFRCH